MGSKKTPPQAFSLSVEEQIIIKLTTLGDKELLAVRVNASSQLIYYTINREKLAPELLLEPLKNSERRLTPYLYSRLLDHKTAYFGYDKQQREIIVVVDPVITMLSDIYFKEFSERGLPIFTYKNKTYLGLKSLWEAIAPGKKFSESDRKLLQGLVPVVCNLGISQINEKDFALLGYGTFMGKRYPKIQFSGISTIIKGRNGLVKMIPCLKEHPDKVDDILRHIGWKAPKREKKPRYKVLIEQYDISKEREGVVMNDLDHSDRDLVVKSPYWLSSYFQKHGVSCSKDTAKTLWEEVNK